jgi:hypothetical protein
MPRLRGLVLATIAAVFAIAGCAAQFAAPARAQTPASGAPGLLCGRWDTTFDTLLKISVRLSKDSAIIQSEQGEQIGQIAGRWAVNRELPLKVMWTLAAFQQGADKPLPASAWPAAVAANPDAAYPNLVRTTVTLRYDEAKDEFTGTYVYLDIQYDDDGKYKTTKTGSTDVRLTRHAPCDCGTLRDTFKPIAAAKAAATAVADAFALCPCIYSGSGDDSADDEDNGASGTPP